MNDKFNGPGLTKVTREPMWPASDKQIQYVLGLQKERSLPPNYMEYDEATLKLLERDEVSNIIVQLKAMSRKVGTSTQATRFTMPPGRYALNTDGREWKFYQVDQPKDGRWKGYTFIKRLIGAPGDYKKLDMSPATRMAALSDIERDPRQAMINYGLQSGVCGRCSSPLSDPESLARGLGPICANKDGWF